MPVSSFQGPKISKPLPILKSRNNWLGESKFTSIVYAESVTVQSQSSLSAMGVPYYYALNDCFDPNFTGSGHQPRGFDQIAVLYKKYRVYSARVQVYLMNPTTATCWGGYHLLNSQQPVYTAGTAFDYTNEVPGTFCDKVPVDTQQLFYDSGKVPIWELEGMTYDQWHADDGFDANVGSSPAAISKSGFFIGDWAAPVGVSSMTLVVKIQYDVKFYSAATQSTS